MTSNIAWFRYELIWEKAIATQFLDAKKKPMKKHESILVFYKSTPCYNPQMTKGTPYKTNPKSLPTSIYHAHRRVPTENVGDRFPNTILRFANERGCHPTQKPVSLFAYLIRTYTNPGELVLDNTAGSGTTAIAAIETGRDWICMEKDAGYFEIAQERIRERLAQPFLPGLIEGSKEPAATPRTMELFAAAV